MTILGKIRSRDERADSHSSSSDEEAPPPYLYGDPAGHGASDSKASLASSDGKNDYIDDTLEQLDPEAVWLDIFKADKHGSSVVRRGSQDVLYTSTSEKRWTSPVVHMFRGSAAQDPEQRPAIVLPFASVKQSSIMLRETPDQLEPTKYKRKQLFRFPKWYGLPSLFTVGEAEYRIRVLMKSWTGKLIVGQAELTVANDSLKTPLCVFRPTKKLFGDIRSSIEILPVAISTTSEPKPHALLQDGTATKLFDMALIAESVVRTYQQQTNSAAASASAASTSAAVAATA